MGLERGGKRKKALVSKRRRRRRERKKKKASRCCSANASLARLLDETIEKKMSVKKHSPAHERDGAVAPGQQRVQRRVFGGDDLGDVDALGEGGLELFWWWWRKKRRIEQKARPTKDDDDVDFFRKKSIDRKKPRSFSPLRARPKHAKFAFSSTQATRYCRSLDVEAKGEGEDLIFRQGKGAGE